MAHNTDTIIAATVLIDILMATLRKEDKTNMTTRDTFYIFLSLFCLGRPTDAAGNFEKWDGAENGNAFQPNG